MNALMQSSSVTFPRLEARVKSQWDLSLVRTGSVPITSPETTWPFPFPSPVEKIKSPSFSDRVRASVKNHTPRSLGTDVASLMSVCDDDRQASESGRWLCRYTVRVIAMLQPGRRGKK